jgi:hypothetical protein
MEAKSIDAVEMTRRIRDAHYEQLREASPEERIRFFREKAQHVHAEIAKEEQRVKARPRSE